ncbi:hypothetical protein [Adhaeretor mobilis]|uniref:PEP-CTERM protein-sorting domain-containing protein n=1 Tax=Adhaeretor mobilis TaxID=1930276 RepID=A0A517N287_9BACT|nr:hypothetical protein [Adhaeretor mobilis]QDT01118.1 hypothetical protein HG15A2_44600 [Adhaeretor mobilis]
MKLKLLLLLKRLAACATYTITVLFCQGSYASIFATQIVEYVPGTGATLTNPLVALGKPSARVPGSTFPGFESPAEPLNPFASHFSGNELVQIGPGGEITLRLENYVNVGAGPELALFGNTALIDSGVNTAGDPVSFFGNDEVVVEVSETGLPGEWVALNGGARVVVETPTNFYADASGLTGPDPAVENLLPLLDVLTPADFGKPYISPAANDAFAGLTIAEIEDLLDGSAGGQWLELGGLSVLGEPLARVGYVRLSDPQDPSPFGTANLFELMAVSINRDLLGAHVPEPTTFVLFAASSCAMLCVREQRRRL